MAYDDQVANDLHEQSPSPPIEDDDKSSGTKRSHTTDDDTDSDVDAHVSKTRKVEKKSTRPKAGDFSNSEKELVLVASNIYRILLASRGPFPNTATEVKLIKKAWRKMNDESGLKALPLTPSFITIVSISITH